jgi:hypothetical protein
MSKNLGFTLVSAHFGDLFWIEHLAAQVVSEPAIERVIFIDQDRSADTAQRLGTLPVRPEVVSFQKDAEQIDLTGHDHPASLDKCLKLNFTTSHVILLDSDCFPVASNWLDRVRLALVDHDAIVARDPKKFGLSHPCFMVLPTFALSRLNFSEGLVEAGIDTGRLVGLQLRKLGHRVYWDAPSRAFRGKRGDFYLDGALYHHGSASFASSEDAKLTSQVNRRIEQFFRSKVARNDFSFNLLDHLQIWRHRHKI